ncbi:hypothetical protein [Maritimibacter sp. UBA3975]|uniref:hypothetical protein n=1 Tax=Maritimibacter sp. UBA3975 TaxID=1946833 RepID=UPI000C0A504E|nr:hypothetical protein [Maritimibacter sp. UBA3975]MAM61429.1 hypothetical protein [Maritimibacter sp.]
MEALVNLILFGLFAFLVVWVYFFLPAGMASRRNRSPVIWVLISLVGRPLLAILLLLALGEDRS